MAVVQPEWQWCNQNEAEEAMPLSETNFLRFLLVPYHQFSTVKI